MTKPIEITLRDPKYGDYVAGRMIGRIFMGIGVLAGIGAVASIPSKDLDYSLSKLVLGIGMGVIGSDIARTSSNLEKFYNSYSLRSSLDSKTTVEKAVEGTVLRKLYYDIAFGTTNGFKNLSIKKD